MIIILIIAIFYFSLILMFLFGWLRIDNENTKNEIVTNKSEEKISVLIAVKNEEKNILYLLNDLKKQNYPQKKFEVIIIDDFSDDNTFDLAKKNDIHIKYGTLGENILVDFDPHRFNMGDIFYIQDCTLEITKVCDICSHLSEFDKKLPKLLKGYRGLYCKILSSGVVAKNIKVQIKERL